MVQSRFLNIMLVIPVVAIVLFPLYAAFYAYPSFEKLITENTSREAIRLATILSSILIDEQVELRADRLPKAFLKHIQKLRDDERILKLRIFNLSGTIVYSTDPEEIGRLNEADYLQRIVAEGGSSVRQVPKDTRSLENQVMPADVVETYVPIENEGRVIGVFELYYDVSAEKEKLRSFTRRSMGVLFGLAVIMLLSVFLSTQKARRMMEERKSMEDHLAESEKRYRTLFENAGDAIFILEGEGKSAGRIVAANKAAAVMHGYTVEELTTMRITDLDTPEMAVKAPDVMGRIMMGERVKMEIFHRRKDGTLIPVEVNAGLLELGAKKYVLTFERDITARQRTEQVRENLIKDLQAAFDNIKTLKGMLPICASCKKIRDDKGYWNQIEEYIGTHTEAEFTHGLCPDCVQKLYPQMHTRDLNTNKP
jgi:PAS domain S-box-containing protein